MTFYLFLIFIVVPVIELAVLIKVGSVIGVFNTVAVVILTAAAGAYLVRREGIAVLYRMRKTLESGVFPAGELMDGALVLVAGVLLITPGFFTDVIGLLAVFPPSRRIIIRAAGRYIEKRIITGGGSW